MNLKAIRASKKLTQIDLAKQLGVARTAIAMWETGAAFPRADKLPMLAKILNCTVDELLAESKED